METMLEDKEEISPYIIRWNETLTCWCK